MEMSSLKVRLNNNSVLNYSVYIFISTCLVNIQNKNAQIQYVLLMETSCCRSCEKVETNNTTRRCVSCIQHNWHEKATTYQLKAVASRNSPP